MIVKRWGQWVSSLGLLCVLTLNQGYAHENNTGKLPFSVFSLSASATGEAANDLMRVTVVAQGEGEDSAELQSRINANMQWALARLRPYTQIDVKTQDYQTFPIYDKNRKNIVGWRASQSVKMETTDVKSAGEAIRKLQERLQVTNIQFQPTPSTRSAVEDQLINEFNRMACPHAAVLKYRPGYEGRGFSEDRARECWWFYDQGVSILFALQEVLSGP